MTVSVAHYLFVASAFVAFILLARVMILPWLLRAILAAKVHSNDWRDRVELRYQPLSTYVWMFAWCKLRMDRMFDELPEFLSERPAPEIALDLGCGFGIAGSAMLEWFPAIKLYGIDPSAARVQVAAKLIGDRGNAFQGAAPDFEMPGLPSHFNLILMLDMVHFLSDDAFDLTLRRVRSRLSPDGWLLLRAPMLPDGTGSIMWKLDRLRRLFTREQAHYRNVEQIQNALKRAGFEITKAHQSGSSAELFWFIARDSAAVISDSPILPAAMQQITGAPNAK